MAPNTNRLKVCRVLYGLTNETNNFVFEVIVRIAGFNCPLSLIGLMSKDAFLGVIRETNSFAFEV